MTTVEKGGGTEGTLGGGHTALFIRRGGEGKAIAEGGKVT